MEFIPLIHRSVLDLSSALPRRATKSLEDVNCRVIIVMHKGMFVVKRSQNDLYESTPRNKMFEKEN